jgi:hypothetical protein
MTEDSLKPLKDVSAEAERVAETLRENDWPLRLIGGAAIYLRCPSSRHPSLRRTYADLDFIGLESRYSDIKHFFESLGYEQDSWFNKLHGRTRMLFWDNINNRQADVFLDCMRMCHHLDFRQRIALDECTLTLADLLLTKLQIVEMNRKDLLDIVALLTDHPIEANDREAINGPYIATLASGDWGLNHTLLNSLTYVKEAAASFAQIGPYDAIEQAVKLAGMIDAKPKSLRWRVRSIVGERSRWYETPEEVARD